MKICETKDEGNKERKDIHENYKRAAFDAAKEDGGHLQQHKEVGKRESRCPAVEEFNKGRLTFPANQPRYWSYGYAP